MPLPCAAGDDVLRCAFQTAGVIAHTLECAGAGWARPADNPHNRTAAPRTADSEWECISNELSTRGKRRAATVIRHDLPVAVGEMNMNGILARLDMQSDRIGLLLRPDLPAASRGCAFPYDAHSGVETSSSTSRNCSSTDSARQYLERRLQHFRQLCKADGKFSAAAWRHFKQTPTHCCEPDWSRALDAQHELWSRSPQDGCLRSMQDLSGWRNEVHVSWQLSDVHAIFYLAHPNPARERAACLRANHLRVAATAVREAASVGVLAPDGRDESAAADARTRVDAAAERSKEWPTTTLHVLPLHRLNATANFGRGVRLSLPGLAPGVNVPVRGSMAYPLGPPVSLDGCNH